MKRFNYAAFLNFPNIIRLNGSNYDSETRHFKNMYPQFSSHFFLDVSLWEKVFLGLCASYEDVITWFGHFVKLPSKSGALAQNSSSQTDG